MNNTPGLCSAVANYNVTSTDNCASTVVVSPASGSVFGAGTTTVTAIATDASGLTATCSFTVTVVDMQAPNAVCKDLTVDLSTSGAASITASQLNGASTDNCTTAANLTVAASKLNFDCSNVGLNNVTLTVTDAAVNTSTCVASVTVRDVTPPTVSCPTNVGNLACGTALPAPYTTATAFEAAGGNISDGCTTDASMRITYSDFNNGLSLCSSDGARVITRTYVVTDASGNSASCTQTFTYSEDTTAPTLTTSASNLPCIAGCLNGVVPPAVQNWLASNGGAAATDACGNVTWTNNYNAVAAQALCNVGGTLPVTFTATDACGNSISTTASLCINVVNLAGVAKHLVQLVNNPNGTADATFEFNIENFGTTPISNVQVTDDLAAVFAPCATPTVRSLTSSNFNVNQNFTGSGANTGLLAAGNTLDVGEKSSILLTIRIPACSTTSFVNTATLTGTAPDGSTVTDISNNGITPNPPNNDGTPVNTGTTGNPSISGLAKRLVQAVANADGTTDATFEFNLENFGTTDLMNVQVTDDLAAVFAPCATPTVRSLTSDDFTVNAGFTGSGSNTGLLATGNVLTVGNKGAILLTIRIPACTTTSFNNTATLTGNSPAGIQLTDVSNNGSDPDPDGDNNPGNNSSTTPVSTSSTSLLGLAKRVVKTENNANGSSLVTFEFNLENMGTTNLTNVQIVDDLLAAFPAPCTPTVMGITSDDFLVNAGFNGTGNNNLLAAGSNLSAGNKGAVLLQVMIPPCAATSFSNTATGTGTAPNGTSVTDVSNNGSDPDPDNDGNPGNNSSTTPVNTTATSGAGLAKRLVNLVNNTDGTSTATFEFNIENFGTTNISNLQVTDNLVAVFAPCATPTVLSLTSDDFAVNAGFTGSGANTGLLAPGNVLTAGNKGAILLAIRIPSCTTTSFANTATLTGTAPNGSSVTDTSNNGSDPDPDGDNNPGNNSGVTPVNTGATSAAGLAKRLVNVTNNADGTTNATFEFNLRNYGTTDILNAQVTENLATVFAPCGTPTVVSLSSGDFLVNTGFTGSGANTGLLATGNVLRAGSQATILLTIRIPACTTTSFNNTATLTGTAPNGTSVTDVSTNGANPDPDGDGNPGNNSSTTPVSTSSTSLLGLAKRVVKTESNANGSSLVTFEFNLQNMGTTNLANVQIVDDLLAAFPAPCTPTVMGITSDDFIANAGFNGTGNNNLLAAGSNLAAGEKGAVLLQVMVPPCATNAFTNTATATSTAPNGTSVTDVSTNGSNPDPDGDGNPGNNGSGTPVNTDTNSALGLAKRLVSTVTNADGTTDITFEFNIKNFGTTDISNLQVTDNLLAVFAACATPRVLSLTSDDYIVNPNFTGSGSNRNLLAVGNTLRAGDKGAILLTIRLLPCSTASFSNTATATGNAPNGTSVTDVSNNGADPDPDNDGNPGNNSNVTPVSTNITSLGGLAKRLVQLVRNADGTTDATFEFNIVNYGNTNLLDVQVTDDLAAVFAPCATPTVLSLTSDDFIVNSNFTGTGTQKNLLGTGNTLTVNNKGAILLTIRIPACGRRTFFNSASFSASPPYLSPDQVIDVSNDGANPDPDGDGNPGNNSVTTPVDLGPEDGNIGIAKRMVQVNFQPDGSALVTFEFNVRNYGRVNLQNIQIVDDLAATFPASCAVSVQSLTSGVFAVNTAYNGTGNNNLLAAGNTLAVNANGTVLLTVKVANCGASQTQFFNTATATATTPNGTIINDTSVDGSNPDPNGNNNPGDDSGPTPIDLTCTLGIVCPPIVSPMVVENDLEWCNAVVNIPAFAPRLCPNTTSALIEYQLSGAGAEGTSNNTWIIGQPSGLRYKVGTTTVRVRARAGSLLSPECTFDITVLDKQNPRLTCPTGIYQFGTEGTACAYPGSAAMNPAATDNCSTIGGTSPLTLNFSAPGATPSTGTTLAGALFPLGSTLVTWTASDAAGNSVTCAFTVMVRDDDAPAIVTCPANVTVNTSTN